MLILLHKISLSTCVKYFYTTASHIISISFSYVVGVVGDNDDDERQEELLSTTTTLRRQLPCRCTWMYLELLCCASLRHPYEYIPARRCRDYYDFCHDNSTRGEKEKDSTTARYYYYWVSSSSWSMEAEGARYGDSCAHYTYLLLSVGFCTIWISCRTAASYNNALTSHSLDTPRDVCSCECDE